DPNDKTNGSINKTIYIYWLLLILKALTEYLLYLNASINNLNSDPYRMNNKFGVNNTIENSVVEITEENKNLIELDDHYSKIFVIKDYYIPGIVRTGSDFHTANCFILCKS